MEIGGAHVRKGRAAETMRVFTRPFCLPVRKRRGVAIREIVQSITIAVAARKYVVIVPQRVSQRWAGLTIWITTMKIVALAIINVVDEIDGLLGAALAVEIVDVVDRGVFVDRIVEDEQWQSFAAIVAVADFPFSPSRAGTHVAVVPGEIDRAVGLTIDQVAVGCEARCSVVPNNGIPDGPIIDGHELKFDAIVLVILDGIAGDLDILNMRTDNRAVLSDGVVEDPCDRITLDGHRCQTWSPSTGTSVFDIDPLSRDNVSPINRARLAVAEPLMNSVIKNPDVG